MKKLITLTLLFTGLLAVPNAQATMSVIDKSGLAQAVKQFQEMQKQLDTMKQQYEELKQMKESLTGSFGMGALFNELGDSESRRALPKTWQEVVAGQAKGFYGDRLKHYEKILPSIDTKLISKSFGGGDVEGYKMSKSNTRSAFAATESVYNQIEERLKTIEGLVEKIDQTQGMKESMDLNSRIVAETGFISLDLARLNAMQLNLQATMQSQRNRTMEKRAKFFGKPDNYNPGLGKE